MKKKFLVLCLLFFSLPVSASLSYHFDKDKKTGTEFIYFSNGTCYNATPEIIKFKNKKFISFGGDYYYDISTYKYNKLTDTYYTDILLDRDPSSDYNHYTKCPFDDGEITHVIIGLKYSPRKKIFKATYKGFASTKLIVEYKDNLPISSHFEYLNIYYNNNRNMIKELPSYLEYYNNQIIKTFGKPNGSTIDIEMIYLINRYI